MDRLIREGGKEQQTIINENKKEFEGEKNPETGEVGGPKGKEPTRFDDFRGFEINPHTALKCDPLFLLNSTTTKTTMFKGGKLKFKRSNKSSSTVDKMSVSSKESKISFVIPPKEITSLPDEGWIKATDPEDFLGPIIFIVPGDSLNLLKVGEDGGQLSLEEREYVESEEDGGIITTANVLVGQNLIPHVFSFKSSFGKYLTCDQLGQVACNKDAVNPLAEWTLILKAEGASLQSYNQKFLSFDPKSKRMRCDSDTIGFNETFLVKCQADRKKQRLLDKFDRERKAASLKDGISQQELSELEASEAKKMQSFGWGRRENPTNSKSSSELKRAAEEGNLREALLERRIKSKHDPFC